MKLESQITNNHSSLIDNQLKRAKNTGSADPAHRARFPNLTFNYFIHEMKYLGELQTISIENLNALRYPLHAIILYFRYTLFMQNKANFRNDKMNITIDMTNNYKNLRRSTRPKNKANSNPIQSQ